MIADWILILGAFLMLWGVWQFLKLTFWCIDYHHAHASADRRSREAQTANKEKEASDSSWWQW